VILMLYKDRRKTTLARMLVYLALLLVLVPVVYLSLIHI